MSLFDVVMKIVFWERYVFVCFKLFNFCDENCCLAKNSSLCLANMPISVLLCARKLRQHGFCVASWSRETTPLCVTFEHMDTEVMP